MPAKKSDRVLSRRNSGPPGICLLALTLIGCASKSDLAPAPVAEPVVFVETPTDPTHTNQPQASAQPELTEADTQAAKRLFTEGTTFYRQGDYLQALERFEQAYARVPKPALKYNIAHCLEQLGRAQAACAIYAQMRDDPNSDLHNVAAQAMTRLHC